MARQRKQGNNRVNANPTSRGTKELRVTRINPPIGEGKKNGVKDRSTMIHWIRSEIVGPNRKCLFPETVRAEADLCLGEFRKVPTVVPTLTGITVNSYDPMVLFHNVKGHDEPQEILWLNRETPQNRYGTGVLYRNEETLDVALGQEGDIRNDDGQIDGGQTPPPVQNQGNDDGDGANAPISEQENSIDDDDIEISEPNRFKRSSIGLTFHGQLPTGSVLHLCLPTAVKFSWQDTDEKPFPVNGWYKKITLRDQRQGKINAGNPGNPEYTEIDGYARHPISINPGGINIELHSNSLENNNYIELDVPREQMPEGPGLPILRFKIYSRKTVEECYLITVVLVNNSDNHANFQLFQAFFEVSLSGTNAKFLPYPESTVNFTELDSEEQNLHLMYHDQPVWAVGHGCSAAWSATAGKTPEKIFADVLPSVETPSMTPDIRLTDDGPQTFFIHDFIDIQTNQNADLWSRLNLLATTYQIWIQKQSEVILKDNYIYTKIKNVNECNKIKDRIHRGIQLIETNEKALEAFRLANHAMLLQSIATKKLSLRKLSLDGSKICIDSPHKNPQIILQELLAGNAPDLPSWRVFQLAFLLMSIPSVVDPNGEDRNVVDLIWFPTGGGKTEAYLAVAAFTMFYQRLIGQGDNEATDVLMRYTLRMLTTQQFQRASALICAMEWLRQNCDSRKRNHYNGTANAASDLGQRQFSLGLWIGNEATPGTIKTAETEINKYINRRLPGNPLVLNECPWCRCPIGMVGQGVNANQYKEACAGIIINEAKLRCPDQGCFFGEQNSRIPVYVVDEILYKEPPSFLIATADKFAMMALEPKASAFFGSPNKNANNPGNPQNRPPVLILQDELHLISGPLGTLYAMYETVVEGLCTHNGVKPKIIASTATIRGAADQIRALYGRENFCLFPRPITNIGDSFFGKYATDADGNLKPGRLYLGINGVNFPSSQTVQVRVFSRVLQARAAASLSDRDPWWTLLLFYNSLRELSGASTLYQADIAARLKGMANRDGIKNYKPDKIEEITGRATQGELAKLLDALTLTFKEIQPEMVNRAIDVAAASNIIEVGVDIDRLSLLGVLGQPKTTSQYIQITGRVGRKWQEKPGLVLMMYNSSKARDISHYEQFHSYHRRLYERVEPTSATPFTSSATERALAGVLLSYLTQKYNSLELNKPYNDQAHSYYPYQTIVDYLLREIKKRMNVTNSQNQNNITDFTKVEESIIKKWKIIHDGVFKWILQTNDMPLIRVFGNYATVNQKNRALAIQTSLRNVDSEGKITITTISLDTINNTN